MVTLPRFLQVEPVGQCNLRCQMCPIQFRQDGPPHGPPAFMDFDVFTHLIDQFPDLEELQLQGLGEPMMHPRFFDMVAHAVRRGIRVGTNTNLTLLNARRAELCVTSGLGELHASIDGATAAVYDRIRVRAHFERIITNLQRLVETRGSPARLRGSAWWSWRCGRTSMSCPTWCAWPIAWRSTRSSSSISATISRNRACRLSTARCAIS